LLFVSNSNKIGHNLSLTPEASLTDGYLDLVIVPRINLFRKSILGIQILSKKNIKIRSSLED
jgi:diacylglycerol kinase (ATP)